MNAPAWVEMQLLKDAERVSDAANEADRRNREAEYADQRTRAARAEIAKLAQSLTEQETCALVSSLIGAVNNSPFAHTDTGVTAMEYLLDVHSCCERGCE